MSKTEKRLLIFLFSMFLVVLSLFVHEHMGKKRKDVVDQGYVLVAKQTIQEGETLTRNNVGLLPMPKSSILPEFETDFRQVQGKQAKTPILKGEIISRGRIGTVRKGESLFSVLVQMSEQAMVKKGDLVNVYVRISQSDPRQKGRIQYQTYVIAKRKEVKDVVYKKSVSGKELPVVEAVRLSMTERQALDYYLAKNMTEVNAKVFLVPYEDVLERESTERIPSFSSFVENGVKTGLSKDGRVIIDR
ncbi:UNVERIFIED_ORG: SAF domain-containing protein [Anoxybacillus amylolyticus]